MAYIKTTASIKPTPQADDEHGAEPRLALATSELMKVIAMTMGGMSVRSYMGAMIEKLVEGGVLTIETREEEAEGEMPNRDDIDDDDLMDAGDATWVHDPDMGSQ